MSLESSSRFVKEINHTAFQTRFTAGCNKKATRGEKLRFLKNDLSENMRN